MPEPHLSDHEQAVLWRRHYECLDALVHGYTSAELDRGNGADPGPAAVTLGDLLSARHSLSVARFYSPRQLGIGHFYASDPGHEHYAGRLEAELQRVTNEIDGRFA
jgi:hypothetical protein